MQIDTLYKQLPEYQGKKRLIEKRQNTYDIIREILNKHRETTEMYNRICENFWRGNVENTTRYIFEFCKQNFPYRPETIYKQTVKTPSAILYESGINGLPLDCKHYASWIVGICEGLRKKGYPIKSVYRFSSYDRNDRSPGHVFAVVLDKGKEIWVDPVLTHYNERKPYYYKIDKTPPMGKIGQLYDISGVNSRETIVSGHRPLHWLDEINLKKNTTYRHMPHMERRPLMFEDRGTFYPELSEQYIDGVGRIKIRLPHIKIRLPKIRIQPGKFLLKIGLAPSRNAFLELVKLNVFSLATDLHNKIKNNQAATNKLKSFWERHGGKWSVLLKNINRGVARYNRSHPSHKITGLDDDYYGFSFQQPEGVGVIQVAAAAGVLAAAAPLIKAIKGLLKSFGIDTSKFDNKNYNDAVAQDQDTLVATHNETDTTDENGHVMHPNGVITKGSVQNGTHVLEIKHAGVDNESEDSTDTGGDYNNQVTSDTGGGSASAQTPTVTDKPNVVNKVLTDVKNFIVEHKTWFIWGGIGLGALIILPRLIPPRRKRRR